MNVFLQLLIAAAMIVPMAWVAFVQWHRMKTIDAIKPAQKWILRACADIMGNHKNSVAVRMASDHLWRFALNSDFLILMGSGVRAREASNRHLLSVEDQSMLDAPMKAAALCTLAFHPLVGANISSLFIGKTYDPEALDKLLLSHETTKRLARKVESEERAVARVISTDTLCALGS